MPVISRLVPTASFCVVGMDRGSCAFGSGGCTSEFVVVVVVDLLLDYFVVKLV